MSFISIREYYLRNKDKLKTPQLIYNRIATRKMKKGRDWKEVKVSKKLVNENYKI